MPRTSKKALTADENAELASRGENISGHFTNRFTVVKPVRRMLGQALSEGERSNKRRPTKDS